MSFCRVLTSSFGSSVFYITHTCRIESITLQYLLYQFQCGEIILNELIEFYDAKIHKHNIFVFSIADYIFRLFKHKKNVHSTKLINNKHGYSNNSAFQKKRHSTN